MHYILFYETAQDYMTRRAAFRAEHLKKIRQAYESGEVVLAGALADPPDQAIIVFRGRNQAEKFAQTDPYVLNGLIRTWRVRPWNTVIGDGAELPTTPGKTSTR